jgi:hypothetical protein
MAKTPGKGTSRPKTKTAKSRKASGASTTAKAKPAPKPKAVKVAAPRPTKKAAKPRPNVKAAKPRRAAAKPRKGRAPAPKRSETRDTKRPPATRPQGAHVIPATVVRRADGNEKMPVMELHWGDPISPQARVEGLIHRWVRRGDALLRKLADAGCGDYEYRADLRDGRFVWLGPDGRVSAESAAQVLCSWSRSTGVVAMGWADPLMKAASIARIDGMAAERDNVDEETAWQIAMEAAEASGAEYLYRVPTPHAWYFLALGKITFDPDRTSFTPSTPVGLVLKSLVETRQAIESRAEPADVLRHRIEGVGSALLQEAEYTYRDSDWVSRLERTGRHLMSLATRLPRPTYTSVAAGQQVQEWLDREAIVDLAQAITLLEDEWSAFA